MQRADVPADLNLKLSNRLSAGLCWLLIFSLVGFFLTPLFLFAALVIVILLVALNFDFYRFLVRKRGVLFTLGAVPLHWLYYLYSSAVFAYVKLRAALGISTLPRYPELHRDE